jgi:2-polyprenyl-6-methoxyphenol hydroxylase-like FAD-dependent oxidoreductase
MDLDGRHVVVAGAATAGTACALLLARAGARVTLCERVAEPRAVGAGIGMAPNGLAVLERLGVLARIAPLCRSVEDARILSGDGRVLLRPRFDGVPPELQPRLVRRSDLQSALLDAVADQERIELRLGTEVISARPSGDVEVEEGTTRSQLSAELVVAADGARSRLREDSARALGARLRATGISYVRGLVEGEVGLGAEAWTRAGVFGAFDLPGATYFFSSAATPELASALRSRDLDRYRDAWSRALPASARILDRLSRFDELLVHEVLEARCERFHAGRLVLAGDAAHAMAPNLGQGANSALVDAAVLADELGRARDLESALGAYFARRRPRVARLQRTAARLGRLAERTSAPARFLRDRVLMPIAARASGPRGLDTLLQEPLEMLRGAGYATQKE